jgi:hypothetical protein
MDTTEGLSFSITFIISLKSDLFSFAITMPVVAPIIKFQSTHKIKIKKIGRALYIKGAFQSSLLSNG